MKKITFLFLLFTVFVSTAQIKGIITDKNNEPLSSVSIYLDKTNTGTTSNDNGEYVLTLSKKGNYTVVFQFLGY